MLLRAGLTFTVDAADVDEPAIKAACRARGETSRAAALALATAKALSVSQRCADALVIGADQMLDCDGRWF
ncbi:MAG: Maf family protein, partial [Defluviicoccus sp.]|nr:Maf family protein [Defluviicoccus sp.]